MGQGKRYDDRWGKQEVAQAVTERTVVHMKGDKGDTGERGETGAKGDKGQRGEVGEIGLRGEKGDRGDKGSKGDQGDRGETGPRGDDGPTLLLEAEKTDDGYIIYFPTTSCGILKFKMCFVDVEECPCLEEEKDIE